MVGTTQNMTSSSKRKIFNVPVKDRLSDLPDELLCKILSELSTKESARTNELSRRWRGLWLHVPALDLDYRDFKDADIDLEEFIDSFLESTQGLSLKRFKLIYDVDEHNDDQFVSWLDQVVERGVSHLTLLNMIDDEEALVRMPLSLFSCSTLVDLRLYCVTFDHPGAELVSLPCVKTMYFEGVKFDGTALESLISCSSVLEDLYLITHSGDYVEVVRVRSQSLKHFTLESQRSEDDPDPDVVIDAPRLEYMSISSFQPKRFVIQNVGPFAKIDVDVVFNHDDFDVDDDDDSLEVMKIRDFLIGISAFHELTISAQTLQAIDAYSEVETLPQFPNLSRLDASLVGSSWEYLPAFLGCCMNLTSLIVELDRLPEIEEIEHSPVPQCVLSSLTFLQLKAPKTPSSKILATYFKKKCTALKVFLSGR